MLGANDGDISDINWNKVAIAIIVVGISGYGTMGVVYDFK